MKRIDDLLDAATSRFRYDAGLRQEIARELRAHLEDSIVAARAEGTDEAQAEESAIRAFGDPEEVGEKLWQANRRRLRRRAVCMAAVSVVLMPAGILAACWFITVYLSEFIPRVQAIICVLAIGIIYLLTRLFLARTARFGFAFLGWLPVAFGKSIGIAFHNAWIWAPALLVFGGINDTANVITAWIAFRISYRTVQVVTRGGRHTLIPLHAANNLTSRAGIYEPWIIARLLLYLGFLLFALWIDKRLQAFSEKDRVRARRWLVVCIVSGFAGMLMRTHAFLTSLMWLTQNGFHNAVDLYRLFDYAAMPFNALISALFLTIVLRRLRGQSLSLRGVLSSAFVVIGPMVWLFLIVNIAASLLPLLFSIRCLVKFDIFRILGISHAPDLFLMVTAFLPAIIVSEQCRLVRSCVRLGDFVVRNLWRYMAFIFLGALLLGLPGWVASAVFASAGGRNLVFLWAAREGIRIALQLTLTVMCFEFYLTKAGTVIPTTAEEAAPQTSPE